MKTDHGAVLLISALCIFFSILFYSSGKVKLSLFLLFLGSLGLGIFISCLDQFLNLWDEQYHALVAKNLLKDPFKPMLYPVPVLDYNFDNWTANHIWLHKQPLFLWQIALSLKIFGINTIAVRIPSILMHALLAPMIYRIGKISVGSSAGFYGALFFSVAFYPLELVTGKFATDHNDIAFMFYVTASLWSWFEYQYSGKKKWIIITGLFSGCAVLVKWLTGLLVYCIWFISISIIDRVGRFKLKSYIDLSISFFIAVMVFLPWQVFILYQYPRESRYEFKLNSLHFFKAVEGHEGNALFHIRSIGEIYGAGFLIPFILLLGLIMLFRSSVNKLYGFACISVILLVYIFFSIAATKMVSFCVIVSPIVFLGVGTLTDIILIRMLRNISFVPFKKIISTVLLLLVCSLMFNFSKIQKLHGESFLTKLNEPGLVQMQFIERLRNQIGPGKFVIFNADINLNSHIPVMFFTDYIAYNFIPSTDQLLQARTAGYKVVVRKSEKVPESYYQNSDIILVE